MPRIGRMRHRLTLQSYAVTIDNGEQTKNWTDVATVSAGKTPLGGDERIRAEKPEAMNRAKVRIRHRSDVDASMRWRSGGTEADPTGLLDIVSAPHDPDGRGLFLEMICAEVD